MIVIHHNDPDGWCSGAIVARYAEPHAIRHVPTLFVEADYAKLKDSAWLNDLLDRCDHQNAGTIFVVDFSLPIPAMELLHATGRLVWIDHHASCKDYPTHYAGLREFREKEAAACELAWRYCNPDVPLPLAVELIADYDAWKMRRRDECNALIVAVNAAQPQPGDIFWHGLLDVPGGPANTTANAQRLVEEGRVMIRYRHGYCRGLCQSIGFETEFHSLRCFALNAARMGSAMFGERFKQYPACLSFFYDGRRFTVSVYSDRPDVDCAAICKEHGGGGHKGAAGFTCETLPFKREGETQ